MKVIYTEQLKHDLQKIKDNNLLKKWLATPVDTEITDALSDHDLVM
ncbi:MAG: hypothetical protein Q7J10_00335 [Methanosarcinaceae archaeon]|nr:hypothetical protein [Methanosarcinaceae archaeon]